MKAAGLSNCDVTKYPQLAAFSQSLRALSPAASSLVYGEGKSGPSEYFSIRNFGGIPTRSVDAQVEGAWLDQVVGSVDPTHVLRVLRVAAAAGPDHFICATSPLSRTFFASVCFDEMAIACGLSRFKDLVFGCATGVTSCHAMLEQLRSRFVNPPHAAIQQFVADLQLADSVLELHTVLFYRNKSLDDLSLGFSHPVSFTFTGKGGGYKKYLDFLSSAIRGIERCGSCIQNDVECDGGFCLACYSARAVCHACRALQYANWHPFLRACKHCLGRKQRCDKLGVLISLSDAQADQQVAARHFNSSAQRACRAFHDSVHWVKAADNVLFHWWIVSSRHLISAAIGLTLYNASPDPALQAKVRNVCSRKTFTRKDLNDPTCGLAHFDQTFTDLLRDISSSHGPACAVKLFPEPFRPFKLKEDVKELTMTHLSACTFAGGLLFIIANVDARRTILFARLSFPLTIRKFSPAALAPKAPKCIVAISDGVLVADEDENAFFILSMAFSGKESASTVKPSARYRKLQHTGALPSFRTLVRLCQADQSSAALAIFHDSVYRIGLSRSDTLTVTQLKFPVSNIVAAVYLAPDVVVVARTRSRDEFDINIFAIGREASHQLASMNGIKGTCDGLMHLASSLMPVAAVSMSAVETPGRCFCTSVMSSCSDHSHCSVLPTQQSGC